MRHLIPAFLLLFASLFVFSLPGAQAQCEAGEVAIEFVIAAVAIAIDQE